ncbi:oxidoreductase [Mangrovactinospora gilvigrisea]|uniref:Oxidoreductase n=1 Tax=Mangrovactinospora gilvigrisea TaxID=1428644 RepID=A0A1J7BPD7_9ACTN|nr:zinc-binding dehydrogenase [Mangrovactinospora gilvigrisea]OIV35313.1 oxidoreductase [Mangrovactinospora gilvigrisea]
MTDISFRKTVVERFGGPEVLRTVRATLPAPPPGHARVKVLAAGVGMTDLMARSGDYLLQRRTPFTPGYELAGEIVDVTPDPAAPAPAGVRPGARVAAAMTRMGGYAEYVVLPLWQLVPLPDGMDPHVAAAVPLDQLTAVSLLDTHGRLRRGDTVLIQGANGGVGRAVGALGAARGLRMYGTASAPDAREALARNGVELIDYRREDFEAVLGEREPGGVQAVFDHLGGDALRKGYRVLAPGGVLVSYAASGRPGHMVGDTLRAAARLTLLRLRPGRRTALAMVPREIRADHDRYRSALAGLLAGAHAGGTAPRITAAPLAEAPSVHEALAHRTLAGKAVLTNGG